MTIFTEYAKYYDLIYSDKDYAGDATFLDAIVKRHMPNVTNLLELGAGTGKLSSFLINLGYRVHGIDSSQEMIEIANHHIQNQNDGQNTRSFTVGDIRSFYLDQKFDVIISLFHVMSYLNSNEDFENAFSTIRKHMNKNGIFVFDCWHGPTVLSEKPSVRVKRFENDKIKVIRIAEPVLHTDDSIVDVNYDITINDIDNDRSYKIVEKHTMRYLFKQEVVKYFAESGMELIEYGQWLLPPGVNIQGWSAYYVVRAV